MNSYHKNLIFLAVVLGIVLLGAAWSAWALDPTTLPGYMGSYSSVVGAPPAGSTVDIGTPQGTVSVNNFYASDPLVVDGDTIIIKQTDNYAITYDYSTSEFWLAILGDYQTYEPQAEQDFLATLGVNETDACKLGVTAGVVYSAGNPFDGEDFPLSFCSGKSGQ